MDTLTHIINGFSVCLQPINLWYTFLGVFLGTIIGVLPGIGPSAGIALLIPVIPREATEWVVTPIDSESQSRFRKTVSPNDGWPTGAVVSDRISRNERLRAQSL